MKLLVGLGNPGPAYQHTRHNIGFDAVRNWLPTDAIGPTVHCHSLLWSCVCAGQSFKVILPQTYMNASGRAVLATLQYFKLSDYAVIYDDFDLPFGRIRIRRSGSAGTHNGLRSIIQHTHSQDFTRIRIGIGPKPTQMRADDFVLKPFSKAERTQLAHWRPQISTIITETLCHTNKTQTQETLSITHDLI